MRLTDDPTDDDSPDLSPDGALVAFHRSGDGGEPRLVVPRGHWPRFSSDGRSILFTVTSSIVIQSDGRWLAFMANGGVFLAPIAGGRPAEPAAWQQVAIERPGRGDRPAGWSPDGRLVYLLLWNDGFRCLWAQRVDPQRGLEGRPFAVQHLHEAGWQPPGTSFGDAVFADRFVFDRTQVRGEIWIGEPMTPAATGATSP